MASPTTGRSGSGGTRFWLVLMAIAVVVFGVNIYLSQQQTSVVSGATANASRLQVTGLRTVAYAERAAHGNALAFDELRSSLETGDNILRQLGSASGQGDAQVRQSYDELADAWGRLASSTRSIQDQSDLILDSMGAADLVDERMPAINNRMDTVVRALTERGAAAAQVFVASRQLLLTDRMQRRIADLKNSPEGARVTAAADGLVRDGGLFGQVLDAMLNGNDELGIRAVDVPDARQALTEVNEMWPEVDEALREMAVGVESLSSARSAVPLIASEEVDRVLWAGNNHGRVWEQSSASQVFPNLWWGFASGAIAILALLMTIISQWRRDSSGYRETAELNQRNQDSILRLLDEMGSLAEGDLTVHATVTEDITGAIADSMNYTVEQLRNLVGTMTQTSNQVAESTQDTLTTASDLAQAAEQQSRQVNAATQSVTDMARSIAAVSQNAALSADVAQRSVSIATEGAQVVRETITGMDAIREQIQETSKRIKRLGESSQEIGAIVELINDISEQTNILALNAAIQAASAGEAGRGFAVVADEVQRLAERAGNATRRIETLVHTIQTDTNEAVGSMEQTTAGVVSGARLAENAGRALNQIEDVSQELARLIGEISDASKHQSRGAGEIAETMDAIRGFTSDTADGANRTARSIGALAQLASELRSTVSDFKLPEARHDEDGPARDEALFGLDPDPSDAVAAADDSDAFDEFIQVEGSAGADEGSALSDQARS